LVNFLYKSHLPNWRIISIAPNLFWHTFAPIFRLSDALTEKSHVFFSSFGDRATLALENERLASENAALAIENQTLLQKAADLSGLALGDKGITAGVVARPPTSPYDTLVIAAGSDQGVTIGMEAFGLPVGLPVGLPAGKAEGGGVPIGVVSSVLDNFSRVTLFSAPGASTNGWVGRENVPLIIKGAGAGAMNASVSRAAGVVAGDTVSVPGPGMLPIGAVVRVDSDPASPSVTLRISPAINLFSTTLVLLRDTGITAFTFPLEATSTLP